MDELNKILGNESIKNYFHSAIEHNRVSHAYIFEGEKGCGKKLITSVFSKILQCEAKEGKPCGVCNSCIQMDHRNHPDVVWVEHEKPNVISVGEIREQVINTIDIKPYKGPYKIYIIDEAEKMNNAAQNTILKTIEEPTEYAILFLLTTNRGAFLPTILSRCILMSVKPVPAPQIRRYLMEKQNIDEGMAEFYAGFSMGNLGRALAISSSEEFNKIREEAFSLLRSIHEMESYELDERAKACKEFKNHMDDFFDIMRMWFRDILILKTTKDSERVIFRTAFLSLSQQEKILSLESINRIFDRITETEKELRANVNFEVALDLLFMECRRMFRKE